MSKKKRVLFVLPRYEIGGTTISLYSLLSKIDPSRLEVDVFAKPVGAYKGKMPNCKELPQNIWISYPYMKGGFLIKAFQTIIYGMRYGLSKIRINLFPLIYWLGGKTLHSDKYDAVVSFSEGMADVVCSFPAKKLIQWVHCDYRRHLAENDPKTERYAYKRYDTVVCVSDYAKEAFADIYPDFATKTIAIHNIINVEDILMKAAKADDLDNRFSTDVFTIVSCGRLDPVKQFSKIPMLAHRIHCLTKRQFRWYIIGGGFTDEQQRIEDEIRKYDVGKTVILLGSKDNPYPYISKADLYVCTSESESFPLAVNEAKALDIPVVTNDFPSVHESIEDCVDGYITKLDSMPERIASFMDSPLKTPGNRINNTTSLDEIYKLFES